MTAVDDWFGRAGELVLRGRANRPLNVPPVDPPTLDPALAFELAPLLAQIDAAFDAGKLAFPHWFITDPLGGDAGVDANHPGGGANSATYYKDRMPGGSITASDGDWDYRDEPYDPFTRPRADSGNVKWQVLDKAWEIRQAYNAGLRMAVFDWLNLNDGTGDNRTGQGRYLQDAVIAEGLLGKFWVNPMIDGNTSISRTGVLSTLIAKAASLLSHPATKKDSAGRPYLFVYMPEGSAGTNKDSTAAEVRAHYDALISGLQSNYGITVHLWVCPQRGAASPSGSIPGWAGTLPPTTSPSYSGQGYYNALAEIADAGRWGSRNPDEALNPNSQNAGAIAWLRANHPGKKWLAPIAPQDYRPNQNKYEEARGFENLLAMFQVAITNGADALQLITWSDLKEGAHFMPSRNHGWSFLDVATYYLCRWYLGFWPTVTRDTIYGAHRIHSMAVTPTKTSAPRLVKAGTTATANIAQALVFLRDPTNTTVYITTGGVPKPFTPSASNKAFGGEGVYLFNTPLLPGPVSIQVVRDGLTVQEVTSPFTVTSSPLVDDPDYRVFSSRRAMNGVPR